MSVLYGNRVDDIAEGRCGGALVGVVFDFEPGDRGRGSFPQSRNDAKEEGWRAVKADRVDGLAKVLVFADIVGMKYLLPLIAIAFAAPVFGRDKSPGPENPNLANWSKLGPTVEG